MTMTEAEPRPRQSEHDWFRAAHNADPVVTSIAYHATAGALFGDLTIWDRARRSGTTQDFFGPTMAYYAAHMSRGTLQVLDAETPVTQTAEITKSPDGIAPPDVRKQIIGTSLYVREGLQKTASELRVHPMDLYLRLLHDGKIEAATWYRSYANDRLREGSGVVGWDFADAKKGDFIKRDHSGSNYGYMMSPYSRPLLGVLSSLHIVAFDEDMRSRVVSIEDHLAPRPKHKFEIMAEQAFPDDPASAGNALGYLMVAGMMDRVDRVREKWHSEAVQSAHNNETGELEQYVHFGTVVYDRDAGIDRSGEEEYSWFSPSEHTWSKAQIEENLKQLEKSRLRDMIRPELPETPEDVWNWHVNRMIAGK